MVCKKIMAIFSKRHIEHKLCIGFRAFSVKTGGMYTDH
jgi:hypothetical protein